MADLEYEKERMIDLKYKKQISYDLERLYEKYYSKQELLDELAKAEESVQEGKGDLRNLYRCFELSAIIELRDTFTIEYSGKAIKYLKAAAQRGYVKAIKVYIVLILRGIDIYISTPIDIGIGYDSRSFGWIKTEEQLDDKYKGHFYEEHVNIFLDIREAETATTWFTTESKKNSDVQEIIDWVQKKKASIEQQTNSKAEYNKKVNRTMRIISIIMSVIVLGGFLYYIRKDLI